jgi:transcriptional regulator with XRE-family HTH domain
MEIHAVAVLHTSFPVASRGSNPFASEDHNMDSPGDKLKRSRERLKLTYRDVEQASQEIAGRRGNPDFAISLSRLADIENGGRTPSIFRLYSLCSIYRLDLHEVLGWYGVPVDLMIADALEIKLAETHKFEATLNGHQTLAPYPGNATNFDCVIDLNKTTYLSQFLRKWGKVPLAFLAGVDHRPHRYGLVGLEDWSMFPILRPGSLVLIDENRRKIARSGWKSEFDRPIYFLEHRQGFLCGWCTLAEGALSVLGHPASDKIPLVFKYPAEIDVVGQVVGVAMLFEADQKAHGNGHQPSDRDEAPAPRAAK